jgi:hypothetical protein
MISRFINKNKLKKEQKTPTGNESPSQDEANVLQYTGESARRCAIFALKC